jgi:hypothetical protein
MLNSRSLTHRFRIAASCAVAVVVAASANAQRLAFSTHDWRMGGPVPDAWADVKTPGNGRTYAVGTTLVSNTAPTSGPTFSGVGVEGPLFPFPYVMPAGAARQVAILQVSDPTGILWQRYFYGTTSGQQTNGLSTYARAISVFPAATEGNAINLVIGSRALFFMSHAFERSA